MKTFRKYFAEFFGTLVLVLFACGTAVVTGCSPDSADGAYLMTALAFGLTLAVLAFAIGPISGCHVNPAVTFAKFLGGKMPFWDCIGYVVAQCFGGLAGGAILYGLFGTERGLGQNALWEGSVGKTILIEGILTCLFVFVVLCVTENKAFDRFAGAIVGAALFLVHIFGIPFTGTSVNPARSLGVAVFMGGESLANVWVFWVGPLLGALVAAMLKGLFFYEKKAPAGKKAPAEKKEN